MLSTEDFFFFFIFKKERFLTRYTVDYKVPELARFISMRVCSLAKKSVRCPHCPH